jgi:hypothetical protein
VEASRALLLPVLLRCRPCFICCTRTGFGIARARLRAWPSDSGRACWIRFGDVDSSGPIRHCCWNQHPRRDGLRRGVPADARRARGPLPTRPLQEGCGAGGLHGPQLDGLLAELLGNLAGSPPGLSELAGKRPSGPHGRHRVRIPVLLRFRASRHHRRQQRRRRSEGSRSRPASNRQGGAAPARHLRKPERVFQAVCHGLSVNGGAGLLLRKAVFEVHPCVSGRPRTAVVHPVGSGAMCH